MTSVSGHLMQLDFDDSHRSWSSPVLELLTCPVAAAVPSSNRAIARTIEREARRCSGLVLWLDCDREGEHIATEVRAVALSAAPQLRVCRAHFSQTDTRTLQRALDNLGVVDEAAAAAVAARQELDLRLGAALTRWQTQTLRGVRAALRPATTSRARASRGRSSKPQPISYGPCQFPALGFVVTRAREIAAFCAETHWTPVLHCRINGKSVSAAAADGAFFAKPLAEAQLVAAREAIAAGQRPEVSVSSSRVRPLLRPAPPSTLDMQKGVASRGLTAARAMKAAESLYTRGFISYPRTETRRIDSQAARDAVEALTAISSSQTGDLDDIRSVAQALLAPLRAGAARGTSSSLRGGFQNPRSGLGDDKAHPAIHPVRAATAGDLRSADESAVYDWVCRRHLAACAPDGSAAVRELELELADIPFAASCTVVIERGWLDIVKAPPSAHTSGSPLPDCTVGTRADPGAGLSLSEGQTRAPPGLSESELLSLMDTHGIGTDATAASHVELIVSRQFVRRVSARSSDADVGEAGGRGRSSRRVLEPTPLGMALAEAYEELGGIGPQLIRPELRADTELSLRSVADGQAQAAEVVRRSLTAMRELVATVTQPGPSAVFAASVRARIRG